MATNFHEFRLGLTKDVRAVQKERQQLVRAIALRALRDLIFSTRVRYGRARGNWQVGEATPPEGYDPNLLDRTGAATLARGLAVIASSSGDRIIWLHNGVPYIVYLEDGPYVQDKMLEGTFRALEAYVRSL